MTGLEVAFYVVGIIGTLGALIGIPTCVGWLLKRLRAANVADTQTAISGALRPIQDDVAATKNRLTRIEAQFGPNGNGLRQAVNTAAADTRVVKETVTGLVDRFEDHLTQSADDRRRLTDVEHALRHHRD